SPSRHPSSHPFPLPDALPFFFVVSRYLVSHHFAGGFERPCHGTSNATTRKRRVTSASLSRWRNWRLSAPAVCRHRSGTPAPASRSEEHTSELQSRGHLVCRLL